MEKNQIHPDPESIIKLIKKAMNALLLLPVLVIALSVLILNADTIERKFISSKKNTASADSNQTEAKPNPTAENYWTAPDLNGISDAALKEQVNYGKELIVHTAAYLGPKGSVKAISNGLNCQNCHLDAGTKVFGNNYGSVAATYPKFRARSGQEEDIYKRVNDCFERSLNGKPLAVDSKEMQAIKAYIEFLGKDVPKGEKAKGSGFKDLAYLDRAADKEKGKAAYEQKCQSCHQAGGEGQLLPDRTAYIYPPLWGKNSYNDAAGLYRLSNFAKYIKYNMPLGATHQSPQLSDEEAWDIAVYVNSQPRPHKNVPKDWPDVSKKPIDHPFGPYADKFSEEQHKFGPFKPIAEFYKK